MIGVAQILRAARADAGLTQAALARAIGVHRVTVTRWERGHAEPSAGDLLRALAACGRPASIPSGAPARPSPLDHDETALLEAQLARRPEARIHASEELARLRASAAR